MGGKMDKPDYVDQDWTSLTEVKTAKWADMMEKMGDYRASYGYGLYIPSGA